MSNIDGPVIVPDPAGKGWFIVINRDHCDVDGNHGMTSQILGASKGYPTYHEAAEALAEIERRQT